MKTKFNLAFLIIFSSLFSASLATAQDKPIKRNDTTICLVIRGMATENGLPLDGATVTLYKENEELEWEEITSSPKHEHNFKFELFGNQYYTVNVSKDGYTTRSVSFNTNLPDKLLIDEVNIFEFDVDLVKATKGQNDDLPDFPIALISYNIKTDLFESNTKYNENMKRKLGIEIKDSGKTKTKK